MLAYIARNRDYTSSTTNQFSVLTIKRATGSPRGSAMEQEPSSARDTWELCRREVVVSRTSILAVSPVTRSAYDRVIMRMESVTNWYRSYMLTTAKPRQVVVEVVLSLYASEYCTTVIVLLVIRDVFTKRNVYRLQKCRSHHHHDPSGFHPSMAYMHRSSHDSRLFARDLLYHPRPCQCNSHAHSPG